MKAKFTDKNGKVKYQGFSELVNEAMEQARDSEDSFDEYEADEYLHDCYISDESGFEGNYTEWLNALEKGDYE